MKSEACSQIFQQAIIDYHLSDDVDAEIKNPFPADSIEWILYKKNWIDTVQWHLEDIIRNPNINPAEALLLKRRIDASNQHRTDMVEKIDDWFLSTYREVTPQPGAPLNTESPAWAIDRLSILELKIYHMQAEVTRPDASASHREMCQQKLSILLEQRVDLSTSINQLIADIAAGYKQMKVYRQMKMYNDASLNPVLYNQKQPAG